MMSAKVVPANSDGDSQPLSPRSCHHSSLTNAPENWEQVPLVGRRNVYLPHGPLPCKDYDPWTLMMVLSAAFFVYI